MSEEKEGFPVFSEPIVELASVGEWQSFSPGLDRVKKCLAALGNPHLSWPHYLIGGTNGKGTVAYNLAKALGSNTGLFLSPHHVNVRERITLAGSWLPDSAWQLARDRVHEACPQVELSYFEWLLVLAVLMFEKERVHAAVFEVGLGGRLDATNSLSPELSVITNVSLDHQHFLGDTVQQIALEKIEIGRSGRPLILPQCLLENPAVKRRLYAMETTLKPVALGNRGYENNALILNAVLKELGRPACEQLRMLPGRREHLDVGQGIFLDGAHNEAGWDDLVDSLAAQGIKAIAVLGSLSKGREVAQFLKSMRPIAASFHHWSAGFENELPPSTWPTEVKLWETNRLKELLEKPLLVCGSLYFVGAFKTWLEEQGLYSFSNNFKNLG